MSYDHVVEAFRPALDVDGAERVDAIWQKIFIPTEQTKGLFKALNQRVTAQDSPKPRGLVIHGDSDTGKSHALLGFLKDHPSRRDPATEWGIFPVIRVETPARHEPAALYHAILKQLAFTMPLGLKESDLEAFTIDKIRGCQVRTIILDEFHNAARDKVGASLTDYLRFLKRFTNAIQRPLVVVGTHAATTMVLAEPQLEGRMPDGFALKPYKADKEFAKIIKAYKPMLPLRRPSEFDLNVMVPALHRISDGYFGRLSRFLEDACNYAIESGEERITLELIAKVPDQSLRSQVHAA